MLHFAPQPSIISWLVSVFVSASLISTVPIIAADPAAAQTPDRHGGSESAAARLAPTLSGTALRRPLPGHVPAPVPTTGILQQQGDSLRRNIIVPSILGSAIGAFAGALFWWAAVGEHHLVAQLALMVGGGAAGSAVGAWSAGGRPDRAFLGALGGGVLGLFVGVVGAEVGGAWGGFAGFSLTQGIAAGLAARPATGGP